MPQKMEQMSLFDLDTPSGKTCPARTVQTEERTSESSSKSSAALPTTRFQFIDLRKDGGAALVPLWETDIQSLGVRWTRSIGEYPNDVEGSGLSQILEEDVPLKYYLSEKACLGILRRSEKRGQPLDPRLKAALQLQTMIQHSFTTGEAMDLEEFLRHWRATTQIE